MAFKLGSNVDFFDKVFGSHDVTQLSKLLESLSATVSRVPVRHSRRRPACCDG